MKKSDIIRAWKDPKFRRSLSAEQRSLLPAHPSAVIDIDDQDLSAVAGGNTHTAICSCRASLCTPCPPRHCF